MCVSLGGGTSSRTPRREEREGYTQTKSQGKVESIPKTETHAKTEIEERSETQSGTHSRSQEATGSPAAGSKRG